MTKYRKTKKKSPLRCNERQLLVWSFSTIIFLNPPPHMRACIQILYSHFPTESVLSDGTGWTENSKKCLPWQRFEPHFCDEIPAHQPLDHPIPIWENTQVKVYFGRSMQDQSGRSKKIFTDQCRNMLTDQCRNILADQCRNILADQYRNISADQWRNILTCWQINVGTYRQTNVIDRSM